MFAKDFLLIDFLQFPQFNSMASNLIARGDFTIRLLLWTTGNIGQNVYKHSLQITLWFAFIYLFVHRLGT